jgi:predicted PurR-regulated permease PerM
MAASGPSTRTIVRVFFTVAALAIGLYLLYMVRNVLGLVAIAVFLAIALGPAVDFFARRKIPRGLSILLVYLCIGFGVVGIGLLVVPPIVTQVNAFADELPTYIKDAQKNETVRKYDRRYKIIDKLQKQADQLPSKLGDAAGALQSVTVGVFSTLVQLVTVLTMTFFLLLDGGRVFNWVLGLFRPHHERAIREKSTEVYRAVAGYVAGALTIATIAGTTAWLTLTALGVPFAVPLAVLMAFLDLIPLVGATIGGIAIAIVTLFNDFPTTTIVWVVVFIVYQQIENNAIQPMVYRRTVDVQPLVVIISILVGSTLLGVLGALVAIPVAATVQILLRDVWRRRPPAGGLVVVEDQPPDPVEPDPQAAS